MGGPGIGKTTLIQQALAHQEIDKKFEIRRWFVSLEHASDIQSFDAEIVRTLNLEPGTNRFSAAMGLLARDHSLIVLDNLERAWEANPVEIEARLRQLAAIPNVVLVASLRGQDAVLGVPWTKQLILGPLDIENSIQLFRQIAPKISSHDPYLRKLISCLGGIPLAIELAALRAAPRDNLHDVWEEWRRVGISLSERRGSIPLTRLTSVGHSIELSLNSCRLNEESKRLFRVLGQLPSGISRKDRDKLKFGFDDVNALLSVGLAYERDGRLDLLPPVRDYARRHKEPIGEDARRWREYYIDLACTKCDLLGSRSGASAATRLRFGGAKY
jgi:hypothetical protein